MHVFTVETERHKQVVDITDTVEELLESEKTKEGICHLFVRHTTASLTVMDLDPGTDLDLLDAVEAMFPKLSYRHPHDPSHVGDHIWSSIIGAETSVPFKNGKLLLGTWQRIVLIELSGPRPREVVLSVLPTAK